MFENFIIPIYFCLIVILQSAIGVGILVLGTPFLLILNYNLIDILYLLLPISIFTSFTNLLIMKLSNNTTDISTYKELIKFFKICLPSIIIGLIFLKFFENYINFKLLVAIVIFLSIGIVTLKDYFKFRINFFRISILSMIGFIHGLTNSGGTLMSLALSTNEKKNYARLNITFFYLLLAFFQYILTIIIFYEKFNFPKNFDLLLIILIGIAIGNILNKFISYNMYKIFINFLAILSGIILCLT